MIVDQRHDPAVRLGARDRTNPRSGKFSPGSMAPKKREIEIEQARVSFPLASHRIGALNKGS